MKHVSGAVVTVAVAAGVALMLLAPAAAAAAADTLSEDDEMCLSCHADEELSTESDSGETLSLHVSGDAFAASVHGEVGCTGCHADVDLDVHPGDVTVDSVRKFTVSQSELCANCHSEMFDEYESSIHAKQIAAGNLEAPVCTDCHGAHTVGPKAIVETLAGVPCKKCHQDVFTAYAGSTHGLARGLAGHSEAPICADCHQAHGITAAEAGDRLANACKGCHEEALDAHRQWLPNAAMHLEAVECPACHSPQAERRIDLRLYDASGTELVAGPEVLGALAARVDSLDPDGKGLDSLGLWNLVRDAGRDGGALKVTLRGRMEVRAGVDAHRLAGKGAAVRNCESCHRKGGDPFEQVTVSVGRPDGTRMRFDAEQQVLSSAVSVDTMRGFYAPGGTRIGVLDWLLLLALAGGVSVPIAHLSMKRFLGRKSS